MNIINFINQFKQYDPALIEAIKTGYNTLFESQSSDSILYHATFSNNIDSIKQNGLLGNASKLWSDWSESNYVYLDESPEKALQWMLDYLVENPDAVCDDITILAVNVDGYNLEHDLGSSQKYEGVIPPERLNAIKTVSLNPTNLIVAQEEFENDGYWETSFIE
jgi:hypothetical protein